MNSGVCIRGSNLSVDESDYYGQLEEIMELEYLALPIKRTVLFKCDWFDPTLNLGIKVHKEYKFVQVNRKQRFRRYEPFVLAVQADRVYFCNYPSLRRDKSNWWSVFKIKVRAIVDVVERTKTNEKSPFQEDRVDTHHHSHIQLDEESVPLHDQNGMFVDLEDDNVDKDDPLLESVEYNSDSNEENEDLYDEMNKTDSD